MSKGVLMKGTLIMAGSGLIIKLIGFVFKIVLARVLGTEEYGIYTISYSVYGPVLMLFVSGIPVAISQLSAAETALTGRQSTEIFSTMLAFSAFFGLLLSLAFAVTAKPLAVLLLKNSHIQPSLMGIAPAIFFAAMLAVFRGYFQGMQQMLPTAISQMVEQIVRVCGGLALVLVFIKAGPGYGAMGVTLAAGAGGFAGWVVLLTYYLHWQKQGQQKQASERWFQPQIIKKVFTLAFPITLGALAISLMQFLDGTIVPLRLVSMGQTHEQANALFGAFGMANSLVVFPTIISSAISVNLIPAIARSQHSSELTRYRIGQAIRWGGIVSFPASVGLFLLAEPLAKLVFASSLVTIPLEVLCWSVFLISLHTVTTGIIQGFGKMYLPAKYLLFGGILNGLVNYILTPIFGIRGAALGTICGYAVSLTGNLLVLRQLAGFRQLCRVSGPAILASTGMGLSIYLLQYWLELSLSLSQQVILVVVSGVSVYFLLLLIFKGIKWQEIKSLLFLDRLFGNKSK